MPLLTLQPFNLDSTKGYTISGLTLTGTTAPIILQADPGVAGQVLNSGGPGATPYWGAGGGASGFSGYSGVGTQGTSGYSGAGASGFSGYSGVSGYSGKSGYSGIGTSGYSGVGTQGTSGYSGQGTSGYSGVGTSGFSGYSGISGFSGTLPGVSGYSGFSGSGGGAAPTIVVLNFGVNPITSDSFSITDAAALTTSKISMSPYPSTASSALGGDELEMDGFSCAAYCAVNGTIKAYIQALPGPVSGTRNFIYTIS